MVLLGRSGSGKSTILRLLADLDSATSGKIEFGSKVPNRGFVFQDSHLMPWRTLLENVRLPLDILGTPESEKLSKAKEALRLVLLDEYVDLFPSELSGGMKMRASLARALVAEPNLLLLDEPFAALDEQTRFKLAEDLRLLTWNLGFKRVAFPYELVAGRRKAPRSFGESMRLAVAMITENSAHPLRVMTWLGLFASAMNVIYAVYVVLVYLLKPHLAEGWVTLSLQAALQFFVISIILTVLSEYVGRLFLRTLPRAPYILEAERNSSVVAPATVRNVVSESGSLMSGVSEAPNGR